MTKKIKTLLSEMRACAVKVAYIWNWTLKICLIASIVPDFENCRKVLLDLSFMLVKGLQFLKFIHEAGQAVGCGHDAAN